MVQLDSATIAFYDELAPHYHLLYPDWHLAISKQGAALDALLGELGVEPSDGVLDAACGIGTQSIGLLQRGYRLTASDISPKAIARLEHEIDARGLRASVYVDDMRDLVHVESESVAAVLACDNSIPHLLSDSEILQAFRTFYRCLRPGGVAVLSVRDYEAINRKSPDVRPYGLRYDGDRRFLAVQVWEWDADQYDLSMYLISQQANGACDTTVLKSRYYAITIPRLLHLLTEAGFEQVERRDDVMFQPVLLGRRANAP